MAIDFKAAAQEQMLISDGLQMKSERSGRRRMIGRTKSSMSASKLHTHSISATCAKKTSKR